MQQQYQPIVDYLNAHLEDSNVELLFLDRKEFDNALQDNVLDIFTTNPSHFEVIRFNNVLIRAIATTKRVQKGAHTFGGVIFTRADNDRVNTIEDLRSSTIAAMDTKGLGGYQAQAFEFYQRGIDIKKNITVMKSQDRIIRSVLEGKHEAGFIRTGMIESEISKGRLKADEIKIINAQKVLNYPYLLSTGLYPDWPVAVLPSVDDKTMNELAMLLLGFRAEQDQDSSIYGFVLPQNNAPVEHLLKSLNLPPYDIGQELTLKLIYAHYRTEIFFLLFLVLIIAVVVLIIINLNLKIRTSEERFELAMEGTQDGLFDWDMLTNSMFHSEQFETMLGYSGTELPHTIDAWKDLLHPDDVEGAYERLEAYLKNKGKEPYISLFRLRGKDGAWHWIEGRGKALFDANGVPTRFVGFHTDVTDKQEHDRQLLVQTKYAQMGEMINMIAHQWRQPLSAITATAASLQVKVGMDKYDKELFNEQLEKVNSFSQYLSETIEDFRNFFMTTKQKETFNVEGMINTSLKLTESLFKSKDISVETHLDSKIEITSFENELLQVVINILKNSYDALLENEVEEAKIIINLFEESDRSVKITVEDNAGGIPDDIRDKIFDPYFSTKSKNGTGLGLYMSRVIVVDHCKGSIETTNTDDGACFTISLSRSVD